jgi:hypothetical protein
VPVTNDWGIPQGREMASRFCAQFCPGLTPINPLLSKERGASQRAIDQTRRKQMENRIQERNTVSAKFWNNTFWKLKMGLSAEKGLGI